MTAPKKGERAHWFSESVVVTSDPQMMVHVTMAGGTTHVPVDQLEPTVDWATLKARELVAAEHDRNEASLSAAGTRSGARDHCPDVHVLANYIRANHLTVDRLRDALSGAGFYCDSSDSLPNLYTALTGEKA